MGFSYLSSTYLSKLFTLTRSNLLLYLLYAPEIICAYQSRLCPQLIGYNNLKLFLVCLVDRSID